MRSAEKLEEYRNLKCHFDVLKYRVIIQPDIVLHESTENQNQQVIYCEVKTNKNANLKDDLEKLKVAISEELNFDNAVMIVINKSLKQTENQIINIMKNESKENLKKMFLFHGIPINNEIIYNIKNFSEIIKV